MQLSLPRLYRVLVFVITLPHTFPYVHYHEPDKTIPPELLDMAKLMFDPPGIAKKFRFAGIVKMNGTANYNGHPFRR